MIITVICCFSVVCTAVLATYGISTKPPDCMAFSMAFASLSILVSAVYYVIVKVSLVAMGTVLHRDARGRGSSRQRRQMGTRIRQLILIDRSQFQKVSTTPQDLSSAQHGVPKGNEEDIGSNSPWSFSSSDSEIQLDNSSLPQNDNEINEDASAEHKTLFVQPCVKQHEERYLTLKVWTNIYGLAVGVFCVVHSLLLSSDLGSAVFCICLWLESLGECCCTLKKTSNWRKGHRRDSFYMPCLSVLMLSGILFKAVGSFLSSNVPEEILPAACNILLPIAGVACIRNMRKTDNIHNTMELSAPVCLLGSIICLMCIVVGAGTNKCVMDHIYYDDGDSTNNWDQYNLNENISAAFPSAKSSWSTINPKRRGLYYTAIRFQPILSVLVIPFPLICAVVTVVSCSQKSHIMVSSSFFSLLTPFQNMSTC